MKRISTTLTHGVGLLALVALAWSAPVAASPEEAGGREHLPFDLQQALSRPMQEVTKAAAKDDDRRASYSKRFQKIDDTTYIGSYHLNIAGEDLQTTERYSVTLKPDGKEWKVAEEKLEDTAVLLSRANGGACYNFDSFSIERHGLSISGNSGGLCELYRNGEVYRFDLYADGLRYDYKAPDYLYFDSVHPKLLEKRGKELVFDPKSILVTCTPGQCEELLSTENFQGLDRVEKAERSKTLPTEIGSSLPSELVKDVRKFAKERAEDRKKNPFSGFVPPEYPGRERFDLIVIKNDDHWIGLNYDSMGGYELTYYIGQRSTDPFAMRGPIFGYYTPETIAKLTPKEIDERTDFESRFYEVWKVDGVVEAGLEDPEMFRGDIHYGVTVLETTNALPFFLATTQDDFGDDNPKASMFINSVQMDGAELTWIQTSSRSGAIVFPEPIPAGTRIELDMDFSTRAIRKINHAYNAMYRGGWLPFVRFGDFVDEFELTIKTPDQYKTLGIGRRVWDRKEGDVRISHWVADSPVVFPTIIFGKYEEGKPGFEAKKPDGTVIPLTVHVDEVSTIQGASRQGERGQTSAARGIRVSQLKSIAEQAANAVNLYQEISGVEYPYGELNLVNDPAPALYGQAPSSLIYLGSAVFRGEGTMAMGSMNAASTSKFLKSVTAHEVGHQWWGSAIANKNFRNYWFVETMAEYFSALYLEAVYGWDEYMEQVEDWKRNIQSTDQWVSVQHADSIWQGGLQGAARQSAIYNKGPYAFHIMRMTFGDERFFPALKQMTQEMAEKGEIVTRDLQESAEKAFAVEDGEGNKIPVDLEWFFDQWIRSPLIPQFKLDYDTRRNEEGGWIVEGTIGQRLVIGSKEDFEVVEGKTNRGIATLTVIAKGGKEYSTRLLVENESTPFRFGVPDKPLEVVLNKNGELLSLDNVVNQRDW